MSGVSDFSVGKLSRWLGRARRPPTYFPAVRVSARVDYAVRAMLELAAAAPESVKGEQLARAQDIPPRFLENILVDLRRGGLVQSQRGAEGGFWLDRPAEEISVADVIRASEGPLATVRGDRPEALLYEGPAESLGEVWIAVRAALREVLEVVSLADIASGSLPPVVEQMTRRPGAWDPH